MPGPDKSGTDEPRRADGYYWLVDRLDGELLVARYEGGWWSFAGNLLQLDESADEYDEFGNPPFKRRYEVVELVQGPSISFE